MIEARGLTKRYGGTLAVDNLSFTVEPGKITVFLGPNGAGKTSTMRLILGLDRPTAGQVTINGKPYRRLAGPLGQVGALLDVKAIHGGRSAYDHLLCLAQTHNLPSATRGRGTRPGRAGRRRQAADRGFLAGHGAAPGDRRCTAGQPADLDARRAH